MFPSSLPHQLTPGWAQRQPLLWQVLRGGSRGSAKLSGQREEERSGRLTCPSESINVSSSSSQSHIS